MVFATKPGRLSKEEVYFHLTEILGKAQWSDFTTDKEDKALLAAIEHFRKDIERAQRKRLA
jgi:hypothetical protein